MNRLFGLLVAVAFSISASTYASFDSRIDAVINSDRCMKGAKIAILVKSLATGELLYARNPDELMIPASNMKLVTSIAALNLLEPTFKYQTPVFYTGKRIESIIDGDLVIKGQGDPHFVTEDLFLMANEVRKRGITRVTGKLIIDTSYFDSQLFPNGWTPSSTRRAYEAPIGAVSLNFNSFEVAIYPPDTGTAKPVVSIDPQTPYMKLENRLRTSTTGSTAVRFDYRTNPDGSETLVVAGHIPAGTKEKTFYRAVKNPVQFFGQTFKEYLRMQGVTLTGPVVEGSVQSDLTELLVHDGKPIYEQVAFMNKFSNNFMAEQILKTIGAETDSYPGTQSKGVKKIEEFLLAQGFSPNDFSISDGSGFGRDNRLTTSFIVSLLEKTYHEWDKGPEFITSLAMMGRDGSVEKRLQSSIKTIRVKTGTLNSVSALSGYYPLSSGDILVFSMMFNNLSCENGEAWGVQHRLLREFENIHAVKRKN